MIGLLQGSVSQHRGRLLLLTKTFRTTEISVKLFAAVDGALTSKTIFRLHTAATCLDKQSPDQKPYPIDQRWRSFRTAMTPFPRDDAAPPATGPFCP